MMFGWFGTVIRESVAGTYNSQVDVSFRMGMMWFIFSEVMFFAAFFGALFYARMYSVPWIGGEGHGGLTNYFLWQGYTPAWPTNGPGDIGGDFETIPAWHLPLRQYPAAAQLGRDHHLRPSRAARRATAARCWSGWPRRSLLGVDVPVLPGHRVHRGLHASEPDPAAAASTARPSSC